MASGGGVDGILVLVAQTGDADRYGRGGGIHPGCQAPGMEAVAVEALWPEWQVEGHGGTGQDITAAFRRSGGIGSYLDGLKKGGLHGYP